MTATVTVLRPADPVGQGHASRDGHVGTAELCRRAGLTWRQCEFWTSTGLLQPSDRGMGSGTPRWYPVGEIFVAAVARQLTDAGFTARPAVALARRALAGEPIELAGGLVRIDPAAAVPA